MKHFPEIAALLLVICAFTACPPTSKNPLAVAKNSVRDARLDGMWVNADQTRYVYFLRAADLQTEALIFGDTSDGSAYTFSTTRIGEQSYIDVRSINILKHHKPDSDYFFARYEFTKNGELRIWKMNEDLVKAAVQSGRLKGKIVKSKNSQKTNLDEIVTLSDSTENLARFVRESDPGKLFDQKFGFFHKLPTASETR